MKYTDLEKVLAIYEERSFTAAAKRLYLTQPAISQNIALANSLTTYYNRVLIDTCALVTSEELDNLMVLDFAIVIVFASTLGVGSLFSAIPIAIWEGSITLAAVFIAPYLSDALIGDLSALGSVLIFGVGVNLLFNRGIKVGNMLPALLGPVIYHMFL